MPFAMTIGFSGYVSGVDGETVPSVCGGANATAPEVTTTTSPPISGGYGTSPCTVDNVMMREWTCSLDPSDLSCLSTVSRYHCELSPGLVSPMLQDDARLSDDDCCEDEDGSYSEADEVLPEMWKEKCSMTDMEWEVRQARQVLVEASFIQSLPPGEHHTLAEVLRLSAARYCSLRSTARALRDVIIDRISFVAEEFADHLSNDSDLLLWAQHMEDVSCRP